MPLNKRCQNWTIQLEQEILINLFFQKWLFYICPINGSISLMSRVFVYSLGDRGSYQRLKKKKKKKKKKKVLDTTLLNTQHYKVRIKGKVEQSREWSSALPYTSEW